MSTNNPTRLEEFRLHQNFEFKLNRLARLMQDRLEAGFDKHGITRIQWIALTAIAIEDKRSPSDLAKHIGVSRPAISRMLKLMESLDLIERNLIGEDARTRQLSLTDKGHLCLNLCWPHARDTELYILNKISQAEKEALFTALHALMPSNGQNIIN